MQITEDIKNFIKERAIQHKEMEVCGLIAIYNQDYLYPIECRNESVDSDEYFLISESQIQDLNITDKIVGYYHSHIKDLPISNYDKYIAERKNIYCVVYNVVADNFEIYNPIGIKIPIVGRPNISGLFDCWNLVEDFYNNYLNIKFKPYSINYHSLMRGNSITFDEKFRKIMTDAVELGFKRVENEKYGDVVLMKLMNDKCAPIHFGILLDDSKILHSPRMESLIEKYTDRLRARTKVILRYHSMT